MADSGQLYHRGSGLGHFQLDPTRRERRVWRVGRHGPRRLHGLERAPPNVLGEWDSIGVGVAVGGSLVWVSVIFMESVSPSDAFTDDDGSTHEEAINRLAAAGVTNGCGSGLYCPEEPVTRAEMASFLARALGLSDPGDDAFSDDDGSVHEGAIGGSQGRDHLGVCRRAVLSGGSGHGSGDGQFLARALGLGDPGLMSSPTTTAPPTKGPSMPSPASASPRLQHRQVLPRPAGDPSRDGKFPGEGVRSLRKTEGGRRKTDPFIRLGEPSAVSLGTRFDCRNDPVPDLGGAGPHFGPPMASRVGRTAATADSRARAARVSPR